MGLLNWRRLMAAAHDTLVGYAANSGIDWTALQKRLPREGVLLKGSAVPVLNSKDKGRSAFVWHLRTDRYGNVWPLLIFLSFRHGGIQQVYHGYRWSWLEYCRSNGGVLSVKEPNARVCPKQHQSDQEQSEQWRLARFNQFNRHWACARQAVATDSMITARLGNVASEQLLKRISLRVLEEPQSESLMVKLLRHDLGHCGYQLLHTHPQRDRKHTLVIRQSGMKRSALACIHALAGYSHWPVAICEGVFTALSVAAFWPGPVAIAIDAGNLNPVRSAISRSCTFFADNDVWGSQNTGLLKARQAARAGDAVVFPQFQSVIANQKPTDFNDLLRLGGSQELARQVRAAWPSGVSGT